MDTPVSPFISGAEFLAAYNRGDRITIIDSHWARTDNGAWTAYAGQHIPGAMFCNPVQHLAALPSRRFGRNPLPALKDLQRAFDDWGIKQDRPVVIYDAGSNLYAARAWWVFRWAGLTNVRILNGGTRSWEAAGGDVAGGIGALRGRGNVSVRPGNMPELFIDDVEAWLDSGVLIDARDAARFAGRHEPLDHQAGHIPGAINFAAEDLQDSSGLIGEPEAVRAILESRGITDGSRVAVYSGSGIHSALFIAAMEHAGLHGARHFVGGWSQWSAVPSKRIERGAGAGA